MILHQPLVITQPTILKDTVFTAGPEMLGKTMIEIPSSPTNRRLQGVHLKRITLDCNGIANTGLAAIDLGPSSFTDISVIAPTQTGVYLAGEKFAMQYCEFKRLDIWCLWNTWGLILDSNVANNANVCFCAFRDSFIHTEGGKCLEVRDCDTCIFENNGFDTASGYSILCGERGGNTWIGNDAGMGKVHFDHPEREYFLSWSTINGGSVPR